MPAEPPPAAPPAELLPDIDRIHRRLCEVEHERRILHRLLRLSLDARRGTSRQQAPGREAARA